MRLLPALRLGATRGGLRAVAGGREGLRGPRRRAREAGVRAPRAGVRDGGGLVRRVGVGAEGRILRARIHGARVQLGVWVAVR